MGQNTLSTEEKLNLITRRQSFLEAADAESLKRLLEEKPKLKLAWETTPTGKPHVGYLVPIAKLLDFLRAGLDVTVYYLDVYGFLVNYIHSMETVAYRQQYYHFLITAILKTLGVSPSQINFVAESSIAYEKDFVVDVQRLCAIMTQNDARDTSNEVAETEKISPLLCSIHQSLSEPYLDLDIQYGGEDQTGLFKHANKFIPMLGYRHREHLMNTMPAETKIEFLDGPETVRDKIFRAACPGRQVTGNGVLGLLRDVLIPISEQRVERLLGKTGLNVHENNGSELDQHPFCSPGSPTGTLFTTYDENGEEQNFASYEAIEATFVTGQLQPEDLSRAVADSFNVLLAPIRAMYTESAEWQKLDKLAYA
ncbi:tyrosyl-trna synthetase [Penicillium cosmopolitanum]|uniref:tyrosine--tRNA ligase n=1 Tax=Penicillium cosmopolitanum TaxID=1131564 RepID=A0A9W9WA79_9EURO|nr:tyrosyl-trna synthetase [Penicillium cosmopolitanum]KAJ5409132.1 tyrosyl-trna synthetase [Penicillium cosmopolitanum]